MAAAHGGCRAGSILDEGDAGERESFGQTLRRTAYECVRPGQVDSSGMEASPSTSLSLDWPNRLVAGSARTTEVQAVKREADSQSGGVNTLFGSLASIIPVGADRASPLVKELQGELVQVSKLAQSIAP